MKVLIPVVILIVQAVARPQYGVPPPPPPPTVTPAESAVVVQYEEPNYEPAVPVYDIPAAPSKASTKQVPPAVEPGMPFDFEWAVNDKDSGNQYDHKSDSDGNITRGSYSVLLPDGRTMVVKYQADAINGYTADVTYV